MADEDGQGERRKSAPRFHGRIGTGQPCANPGCAEPGEFRAPPLAGRGSVNGPGDWRWLCLDHVRAFNAGYNFFSGMTTDEIHEAQHPLAGWERETRAFAHAPGGDPAPKWTDFSDPLSAIQGRFGHRRQAGRTDGRAVNPGERKALEALGLNLDADRAAIRKRYSELVRRYHPDRNGGDRGHEKQLQQVVEAYQLLRKSATFA